MKTILSQLIADSLERELPELVARERDFPGIPGKADVAIGMRRTGKTFFCYQKMKELLGSGVKRQRILYLNFEDERLLAFSVKDFQAILDVYYGRFPENKDLECYFFFDEIQRIDQWEMFIRRLLDTEKIRIFLTGSSSKLLSTEIATSLRGRSLSTEIFPFSFAEFLKANGLFGKPPQNFGSRTAATLRRAIADYLETGGFPEVLNLDRNLRVEVLQGYIDSVILKDVIERHRVGNVIALKHLVSHIMHAPGGKFSVNRFYNTLKSMAVRCTKNSLYEYLDHLLDAYLLYRVPIHSHSEKARMLNPPKIYTVDTGLLGAMTFRKSANNGPLLENLVFMHLRRNGYEAEYVNTREGGEADFLARHKAFGDVILIQACWDMADQNTFNRELRGLQSAMQELSINSGTIVTWDDEAALEDNISVVPVWKWLLTSGK
ncbi:MAG: ATP-binding protein [Deltaproteobacteria bacterium]|nr:ATP-binding protein [Deltaproteobacteria bacterium]